MPLPSDIWLVLFKDVLSHCTCGVTFSIEHKLSCPRGGFTILRHNDIRDFTANVLSDVCYNVSVEPHLQPLSGERFMGALTITDDGARLDIAADGFWGGWHERAFFDVRIFNPFALSKNRPIRACYRKHETQKRRSYNQWVVEAEHGSFTPLVLSATGGMGTAASIC